MNLMHKLFIVLSLILSSGAFAQNSNIWDFSINGQLYPAGFISTLSAQKAVGTNSFVGLRLGHNLVRHGNLGVQDNERGQGFGGSIDYTYYLKPSRTGWYGTARSDLWFNKVDWKNNIGQSNETSGTTDIIVVQPTAEVGYTWLCNKNFFIRPNLAFGAEINVDTQGEEVGEGAIGLLGISFGWRKN